MKNFRFFGLLAFCFVCMNANLKGQVTHTITLPQSVLFETKTMADGGNYTNVNITDLFDRIDSLGHPNLPIAVVKLLLPHNTVATAVSAYYSNQASFDLTSQIMPAQHPTPISSSEPEPFVQPIGSIYSQSCLYPGKVARILNQGTYRGNRIATIAVYPI